LGPLVELASDLMSEDGRRSSFRNFLILLKYRRWTKQKKKTLYFLILNSRTFVVLKLEHKALRCYRILCVDPILCYATGDVARAGWETRAWAEQPIRSAVATDDLPTLCSLFSVLAIPLVSDWNSWPCNNDHHQPRPQISISLMLTGLGNSFHLQVNSPMGAPV
jgi:hypothetical protein